MATSQPLASAAGLRVLLQGGNAVDAAVAASATLGVVEPMATGVGGDTFALVWTAKDKRVHALNGSGRAPLAARANDLRKKGLAQVPPQSACAVTVPGALHAWDTLLRSHGTITLAEALRPAIEYAEQGYPVSEIVAFQWQRSLEKLRSHPSGAELTLDGAAPRCGQIVRLPQLARTLRQIAAGGADAFYRGPLAERTARYVQEQGGWLSTEDLERHTSTWDEPLSTDYRGVRLWECPPNGQGLIALLALNIVQGLDIQQMGFQTARTYHYLIEATRLAMADGLRSIADPLSAKVPVATLLSPEHAAARRALIDGGRATQAVPFAALSLGNDTVYVACVDAEGNACSLISSIFEEFGSGLVVPGTGIALHNRGALFSLSPDHPNSLEPGKRPYHTIIPALATRGGELWLTMGVMGGFQQPQGHLQVMVNMVDFGLSPQAALDARRFSVLPDGMVALEDDLAAEIADTLGRKGHRTALVGGMERILFGGGQIIERDAETGALRAGSEPRKDGCALGF